MKTIITLLMLSFGTVQAIAQVSYEDNDPGANTPLGYIGWNDNFNTDLEIRQNNRRRMRFTSENWPGYNAVPLTNNVNRIFIGQTNGANEPVPFSMMQFGTNLNDDLNRDWMNVGTTYGAGADILYMGILQSPGTSNNGNVTDGVIAWGDNDGAGSVGPDVLRFLFTTPGGGATSISGSGFDNTDYDGVEIARMHGDGRM